MFLKFDKVTDRWAFTIGFESTKDFVNPSHTGKIKVVIEFD